MAPQWHHLANAIELVLQFGPSESTTQTDLDGFSHFYTAHGRACPFPLKIAPRHGAIWTPSNTWLPGRTYPSSHPKRHLDRFSHFAQLTAECRACPGMSFPKKNWAFALGDLDVMVPLAHPSPQPKRHLDRFSRFCGAHYCNRQTDKETDRARDSACNNRPHLRIRSTAVRSKKLQFHIT